MKNLIVCQGKYYRSILPVGKFERKEKRKRKREWMSTGTLHDNRWRQKQVGGPV
jgi:hypothetical protein